jgi:uncharacterized protein YecE (DUF72 family)
MNNAMAGRIFVGTSGWNYKHWSKGVFYPRELKPPDWLAYYARSFDTVEINFTFYRLPDKSVFDSWRRETPEDFVFAVKASRFITHMKKLLDPGEHVPRLLENASGLAEKLGVILYQLPPRWRFNPERLRGLLEVMDRQAVVPGVRTALEVRDESWYNPACFAILEEHNAALVLADQPGFAVEGPLTADFAFLRRHGPGVIYGSDYPDESLRADAGRLRAWAAEGRDAYIYFNNDASGFAIRNARTLKAFLAS